MTVLCVSRHALYIHSQEIKPICLASKSSARLVRDVRGVRNVHYVCKQTCSL